MRTFKEGTVVKCTRRSSQYSLVDEGDYYEVARFTYGSPIVWLMSVRTGITLCASLENEFEPVGATEFLASLIVEEIHSN